jgi:hypothetical protein
MSGEHACLELQTLLLSLQGRVVLPVDLIQCKQRYVSDACMDGWVVGSIDGLKGAAILDCTTSYLAGTSGCF